MAPTTTAPVISELSGNGFTSIKYSFSSDVTTGKNEQSAKVTRNLNEYRVKIVWKNVIIFIILHGIVIHGLLFAYSAKISTIFITLAIGICGGIGVTAGAHRLWAHKSYKAKWPLRVILMVFQTIALQNDIHEWVRDHRVHHKFTDTAADPHDSRRGFFFSHIGWLMVRKHKDVIAKGKTVDMSDLENDAIVMFQKRHYIFMLMTFTFGIPIAIPYYLVGESFYNSFLATLTRYLTSLHITWLVNSAAHMWGMKPYDKQISSVENYYVAFLAHGEGFHNYHHTFPWDYKAAELGNYGLNVTTAFIDFFSHLGWAYDMKSASAEMVRKRCQRTGDQFHSSESEVWGWDDDDMSNADRRLVTITNPE